MKTGLIYKATVGNQDYIGCTMRTLKQRIPEHLAATRGTEFHKAIQEHGADAVTWEVLESGIPRDMLSAREVFWIVTLDTFHNGLNSTAGGREFPTHTDEVRQKISDTQRKTVEKGTHHLVVNNPMKTPEQREKQSQRMREAYVEGEHNFQKIQHPMKDPKNVKKMIKSNANTRFKARRDAGQEFLLDMEIGESEE